MKIATFTLMILGILAAQGFSQGPASTSAAVFTDSQLGFRYTPPPNLRDLTEAGKQSIKQRAAAMGKTNTLTLLLSLLSGPDDTAVDWHSIGIESYPREKMRSVSDLDASRTFSQTVSGAGTETGQPTNVQIGGSNFVVSTFELREGQLTKHARVYTTVRNGQMLAFAFSANSADVLNGIVDSMKTFQPTKDESVKR
jgi:hypothetical protein